MNFKKTQLIIFYLLLFLLPSNLGYHFILPSSYVQGILVDYLIPTLYLTDILILGLFGLWLIEMLTRNPKHEARNSKWFNKLTILSIIEGQILNSKFKISNNNQKLILLVFGFLFLVFNIKTAANPVAALYKWLKLAEMGWLAWYLGGLSIQDRKTPQSWIETGMKVISLSVVWQSGLAIAQWAKQGSVFGYWFFGEQPYTIATSGIKTVSWFGQLKAVPMGTFPHPNVLATFLALGLLVTIKCCFFTCDRMLIFNTSGLFYSYRKLITYSLYLITSILGTITLFLTFSLPTWGVLITIILKIKYQRLKTQIKNKILFKKYNRFILLIFFGVTCFSMLWGINSFGQLSSLTRRTELAKIAYKMWLSSPLFGVGLNNFTIRMPEFGEIAANIRFLQPVHNIPLLILAETGILGFFLALFILLKWFKFLGKKTTNYNKLPSITINYLLLFSIIFLSLFDHYFLTTQQGLLMVTILFSLKRVDRSME